MHWLMCSCSLRSGIAHTSPYLPQPDESLPSYPHPHPTQVVVTPIGRPVTEARVLRVARDIALASLNDIASASIGRAVSAVLERDSALLPLTTDVGTCDCVADGCSWAP
jgi:hypothetical protein